MAARRSFWMRLWMLLVVGLLVTAACGGGEEAATTTEEPTTTSAPTTTRPTTTTTEATTTTAPAGPVAPLTGLPATGEVDLGRPALVIKIDNHPDARPQVGLDLADIVFEVRAEGVTRFAAVFHSRTPDPVGPVRSSRTSDFDLLRGFDHPLYGSSGGNEGVMAGVRELPVQALTNNTRNEYFRDSSRPAPHNLMVNASDLWALANDQVGTPTPWFAYRLPTEALPATAVPAPGPVTITFTGRPRIDYVWDAALGGWLRSQDGRPHTQAGSDQLAPENVVVLETTYVSSSADSRSPELVSVGSGRAVALTGGQIIEGGWSRPTASGKPVLVDTAGAPIALTPGQTWIEMPEAGQTSW